MHAISVYVGDAACVRFHPADIFHYAAVGALVELS